jgi:hypothetical protein
MNYKDIQTDATVDHSHSVLWLLFLIFIIFVFAGLWIVFDASNSYDTLMGGISTLLFSAASIALAYKLKAGRC